MEPSGQQLHSELPADGSASTPSVAVDTGTAVPPVGLPLAGEARSHAENSQGVPSSFGIDHSIRETVESVIVAVILAFLFRGVVAEAFVIPTGSMAPTLQGRHMDLICPQCRYQYRTGASVENTDSGVSRGEVVRTRCPICRFTLNLDKEHNANHRSFNGDRILVSKFAYHLAEPDRWDVVVFKYPGDAKTPYIKRLIGLPGETIRIHHGDIYARRSGTGEASGGEQGFAIIRKPPEKSLAMLQLVDDTDYVAKQLRDVGWPSRWSPWLTGKQGVGWKPRGNTPGFSVTAEPHESWLHYAHRFPRSVDWRDLEQGKSLPADGYLGQLITDYYAYNDSSPYTSTTDWGAHCWVGDLAMELDVAVSRAAGELLLDLVEGGVHHRCSIDLLTGRATVEIDGGRIPFLAAGRPPVGRATGQTRLRGSGTYQLRFANVDDELRLWVNGRLVEFDIPTTFESPTQLAPQWSPQEPGDLAPARLGARGAEMAVTRLRVLRDVYYRAVEPIEPYKDSEYDRAKIDYGFDVNAVMSNPHSWSTTPLFAARRSVECKLAADQFFPLGDNSPESRDARLWSEQTTTGEGWFPPQYVQRELLIGEALLIYWPHAWRAGNSWLPIVPNFQRMGVIR